MPIALSKRPKHTGESIGKHRKTADKSDDVADVPPRSGRLLRRTRNAHSLHHLLAAMTSCLPTILCPRRNNNRMVPFGGVLLFESDFYLASPTSLQMMRPL